MIQALSIRNFQSLAHVDLDLAPYTVIVGKSSSGKSALTRAIKTLTSNRRGLDFVTHGESVCTITATTEHGSVTLSRGKVTDDNSYTLTPTGPSEAPTAPQRYTKLGAATPVEVSQFLGIDSTNPINYAGQHDKPFMLADSPGTNAATLGRLTNVDVIFSAAKESNRQKLDTTKKLGLRVTDLDSIKEKAKSYAPLAGQHAALAAAEESLGRAYGLARDIERIKAAWDSFEVAKSAQDRLKAYAAVELPTLDSAREAYGKLTRYQETVRSLQSAVEAMKSAQTTVDSHQGEIERLQASYGALLASLGLRLAEHMTEKAQSAHKSPSGAVLIELEESAQLAADYIAGVLA